MSRSEQTLKQHYSSFVLSDKRPQILGSLSYNEYNADNANNAETTSSRLTNPDNIHILLMRNSLDIVRPYVELTASQLLIILPTHSSQLSARNLVLV